VESGATVPYPPRTANYHYEMELVLAIGKPGFRVSEADAHELIYGYAAGLDMTRRDLQLVARDKGRPWDTGQGHRKRLGVHRDRAHARRGGRARARSRWRSTA
jgi:2-keto-4-pentenoate hydratase/2-oxohepta-3-ene-1,7-dioic acid hydratase in catechol pathway